MASATRIGLGLFTALLTALLTVLAPQAIGPRHSGGPVLEPPDATAHPAAAFPAGPAGSAVGGGDRRSGSASAGPPFPQAILLGGTLAERRRAVRVLGRLGTADAVGMLSYALSDPDPRVRDAALQRLAAIGTDDALAAIASLTAIDDAATRARAVEAIARTDSRASLEYLDLALNDPDPRVRAAAVESLGDLGDGRAVNIIGRALRDPDSAVRRRAAETLDELDDETRFHALFPPR